MKTINSLRSKLFAFTLALMASVASFAYYEMPPDFKVDGLYYNFLEGDNVEVTHPYRPALPTESASNAATQDSPDDYANLTELTIPSTVTYEGNVYHVTRIGHHAFDQCENLTSVDIPNSIKSIGIRAFSWCSALTSIVLKGGLENIESYAFEYCLGLENISLPNSLMTIGQNAFYNTQWYKNQPNGGVYVGNVFYKYKGDIPQNTSFVIKEGTVSISPYAFVKENYHEDYSLVSVSIPNSVKVIGEGVFYRCRSLTSIVIPDGVTTIETLAFHYCKALNSVTCKAVEPPVLGSSVFSVVPLTDATLYVPAESVDAYKNADQWKDFGQILPIEPTSYKSQWCDTWNVMWFDGMFFDETASTSQYRLGKDTIIGDYTYSKFTSRTSVRFTDDKKVYVYYEGFDDNDPYTEDLPTGEYLAYDFSAKVGDTLEVFSGIGTYSTYPCVVDDVETAPSPCVVDDVQADLKTFPLIIKLHPLCDVDGEGNMEISSEEITWIEGVGSPNGFLISDLPGRAGGGLFTLLCAYKDDELKYTGSFYERFGCDYNAGVISDDLFPTLSGLQRTICREYYEQADNKTRMEQFTNLTTRTETGAPYIYCSPFLLREKDNKILIYSRSLNKDLVLYDFNLQVGDSLPMLYIDFFAEDDWIADRDMEIWCIVDYHKDLEGNILPADTLIVTDVSAITLLDGKEYKKWTFNNGMEYVEGIGSFGNRQWSGDFFQLIANRDVPTSLQGEHLVCASKNGQLLYQMDDAEMERLGAECLCDVEKKWTDTWCDTWNVLEHDRQYSGSGNYNEQTWRHYLAQDTIINGQTYTWVNCYWTLEESKVYRIALVRFTEDKKVYLLSGNQEQLVYDFSVEVGDTIETIVGAFYGNARQQLVVHQVDVDDATNRKTITLYPLCKLEEDFDCDQCDENGYYLSECCPVQWIEGVGSTDGFLMGYLPCSDWVGGIGCNLLCAYKDDELQYISKLYQGDYGCEYNAVEQNAADLFPTLWGLQRTVFHHYTECSDNYSSLTAPGEIVIINGKPYLRVGEWFLREANNQVLIYSAAYDTDFVLYDWNLEVGDSISLLAMDYGVHPEYAVSVVDYRVIVDIDENGDLLMDTIPTDKAVVDKISTITLLDGKEYKTWHLATEWAGGITYVEGIGILSEGYGGGDYFGLIIPEAISTCYLGDLLVCVSRNGQLLYQMDDAEMERLGAECLCDYDRGPRKDNAKDGQIGGRPTPTQWNQLELDLREMDNGTTILRAETFSYTLENDSVVANDKIFYQLARQSTKDTATTKSFVGALHFGKEEDNRVYFLRDGIEYVLYDFTAEPGDTVEIFAGINNYPQDSTYTHVVVDKDTTENGACRMFLEVVFPEETTTATNAEKVWLAGLGSVDGIVHNTATRTSNAHAAPARSANSETQTSVMLCAWREDSCLYITDHPDYNDIGCIYNQDPTSIEDTHSPSPTTDYQKLLRDGQLLIIHKGKTYNVLGVQVK